VGRREVAAIRWRVSGTPDGVSGQPDDVSGAPDGERAPLARRRSSRRWGRRPAATPRTPPARWPVSTTGVLGPKRSTTYPSDRSLLATHSITCGAR